jgi:hypothetical protein
MISLADCDELTLHLCPTADSDLEIGPYILYYMHDGVHHLQLTLCTNTLNQIITHMSKRRQS